MRVKDILFDRLTRFRCLSRLGLLNNMSDEKYIKKKYYLVFHKRLDLKNVKTFNEKLQWLKLYDRKDIYTMMVDKYEIKKYVADQIGEEYIIPTIGIYDKFDDIEFGQLPKQFVIKCTHDSGGLVICRDKSKLDLEEAKRTINKSLKRNYYYAHREWPYKNVKPRIIIEKYMEDKENNGLTDYKVMCFDGIAKMIFTCTDRFNGGLKVTFFDLKWKQLPFTRHYPSSNKPIKKPVNLKKMIELSELLSKGIPFVRMDWYEINGKLYFGEFTFYPGSGLEEFNPEEWDEKIGRMLKLPLEKKGS
ncbi:glycosyl transferase [Candidatus Saccharibacteria bacterium]|nr:glycosyl transferase [Candidatus Saccharibacteria bacterium]